MSATKECVIIMAEGIVAGKEYSEIVKEIKEEFPNVPNYEDDTKGWNDWFQSESVNDTVSVIYEIRGRAL